ncbi:MAG: tetratricopeptide repeat protein [Candidatus Acidiferrales bacterium]
MPDLAALTEFKEGIELLKGGYHKNALPHLRRSVEMESSNPYYLSFLGVAISRSEKKWSEAVKLCETALQLKRKEMQMYLNLAEVYAAAGRRDSAIFTLDRAMENFGPNARLVKARSRVEKRRPPILPFLQRTNLLNRELGKLRHRASKYLTRE